MKTFKPSPNHEKYLISRAAVAAALGTTTKMITQAYEHAGVISSNDDGLFPVGAIVQIIKYEESKLGEDQDPKRISEIKKNLATAEKAEMDTVSTSIKIKVMRGELLPRHLVERYVGAAMVTIRSRLLVIGGQVTKTLAIKGKDKKQLEVAITNEIKEELHRTADELGNVVMKVVKENTAEEARR